MREMQRLATQQMPWFLTSRGRERRLPFRLSRLQEKGGRGEDQEDQTDQSSTEPFIISTRQERGQRPFSTAQKAHESRRYQSISDQEAHPAYGNPANPSKLLATTTRTPKWNSCSSWTRPTTYLQYEQLHGRTTIKSTEPPTATSRPPLSLPKRRVWPFTHQTLFLAIPAPVSSHEREHGALSTSRGLPRHDATSLLTTSLPKRAPASTSSAPYIYSKLPSLWLSEHNPTPSFFTQRKRLRPWNPPSRPRFRPHPPLSHRAKHPCDVPVPRTPLSHSGHEPYKTVPSTLSPERSVPSSCK